MTVPPEGIPSALASLLQAYLQAAHYLWQNGSSIEKIAEAYLISPAQTHLIIAFARSVLGSSWFAEGQTKRSSVKKRPGARMLRMQSHRHRSPHLPSEGPDGLVERR